MRTFLGSGRGRSIVLACTAMATVVMLALWGNSSPRAQANYDDDESTEQSKIQIGFEISPVKLKLEGRNRALVGLGSYIVNAQAGCSDCHTFPNFEPGGSPYLGQPEAINVAGYLAGGRPFGPFVSNDLTPDPVTGLPAGMTFAEFEAVMRTGIDRDHSPPPVPAPGNDLLQVMPWPVFRNMNDQDMRAIYEYLRSIPSSL